MRVETADKFFLTLCNTIKAQSKDPSTQTACVIAGPDNEVRSIGYNGLPRGVAEKPQRYERPGKYKWVEHCERNAVYNAARAGISVKGCTMYLMWYPCADCARAIIQSGISTLVVPAGSREVGNSRWGEDFAVAEVMLAEAGVEVRETVA